MQLRGLMFLLLITIVIPITILLPSHNVFFMVVALLLIIDSARKIYVELNGEGFYFEEDDDIEEELEEFEELYEIDIKKFDEGIKVARNLVIILFYLYCSFFVTSFLLKVIVSGIMVYWTRETLRSIRNKLVIPGGKVLNAFRKMLVVGMNLFSIIFIAVVAYNKYVGFTL